MKHFFNALSSSIFWGWNLVFLFGVYVGILPFVGGSLIQSTAAGLIPVEFLITLMGLIAIPTGCTILGWRFHDQPLQLIRLFYGVEAPLFLLFWLRLFVIRELTAASTFFLASFGICIAAFLAELWYGYARKHQGLAWLQLAAHSLMLLIGGYVGILILFFAVPIAAILLAGFFSFAWVPEVWSILTTAPLDGILWFSVFLALFAMSATLFIFLPSALTSFYIYEGQKILRAFAGQYGRARMLQGTLGVLTACLILFSASQNQPQTQAFAWLETPTVTPEQRQDLLAKSDQIRQGLVNGYLSAYRYLGTASESNTIKVMYRHTFNLPEPAGQWLQNQFNFLISPFLYQGDSSDTEKAGQLYAEFFDQPIQKAEQKAVLKAVQSTVSQDEAKAGLLNIGQKKVWLRTQEISVQEQGDWAEVELYEVYENQTSDVEEILYYFSLPESATITGVWLGDTGNREQRFEFQVSPRGAAQKVYNAQVQRINPVDPALLEQVGPRQYRLRAFPVPPPLTPWEREDNADRPTEMHLWLTYKVMQQEQGWALPILGEKRNLFWTEKTQRVYNGKPIRRSPDQWLPEFMPASSPWQPSTHQAQLGNYQITATPATDKATVLPQGKRLAVVIDTSRSMGEQRQSLSQTLDWLQVNGFDDQSLANNDADVYLAMAAEAPPKRLNQFPSLRAEQITFFGKLQLKDLLRQFAQLREDTPYDAVVLISDQGNYELSDDSREVPAIGVPVWVVHLDGLSPAYDDAMLEILQQSGGGVGTELAEVWQRLETAANLGTPEGTVIDGYTWVTTSVPETVTVKTDGFAPLASRHLIQALSRKMDLTQLAELDAIHGIAKTYNVVSPYSSMIVLVNDEQRQALKEAEASADRFNRSIEDGNEVLTQPDNPLSTPVPEPGMILGLVASGGMLIFFYRHRLRKRQSLSN